MQVLISASSNAPQTLINTASTQGAQIRTQTTTCTCTTSMYKISNTFSQSKVGHEWDAPQPVAPQVSNTSPSQESCPALKKRKNEKNKNQSSFNHLPAVLFVSEPLPVLFGPQGMVAIP